MAERRGVASEARVSELVESSSTDDAIEIQIS